MLFINGNGCNAARGITYAILHSTHFSTSVGIARCALKELTTALAMTKEASEHRRTEML